MNDSYSRSALRDFLASVDGWLSLREAMVLYELARCVPASGEIVEIGSYKGRSTIALAYGAKYGNQKGYVWAIDPHEGVIQENGHPVENGTFQEFQDNTERAGIADIVRPLVMTSREASRKWKKTIRLLFIDGLHDERHATEDYSLWAPFVSREGGVIAFHDGFCGERGVWRTIRRYVWKRKDLVDIGATGSILYVMLGNPKFFDRIRVWLKKHVITVAYAIHSLPLPWIIKKLVIHRGMRLLLLTRYSGILYRNAI